MTSSPGRSLVWLLMPFAFSACEMSKKPAGDKVREIAVTQVEVKTVTLSQQYSGQIRSHHRIEVRAPVSGILDAIPIKEKQPVKQNELLFQIKPTIDKTDRDAKNDASLVSITAPFDGVVDRLLFEKDSFVQKGETLTNLSDDSIVWVYFNVPEARYLDYKTADLERNKQDLKIELMLRNGKKFDHDGALGAIGATFNSETGSVAFRADFPNPEHQLRHGQAANVLISRVQNDMIVVPQQAVFELLQKRYVYVVDKDDVVHQRRIVISNELENEFVVESGVTAGEKIVVEGVRLLRDGDKVKYDDQQSNNVATAHKDHVE